MTVGELSPEFRFELGLNQAETPEHIEGRLVDFVEHHYQKRTNLGKGKTAEVWVGKPPEFHKDLCIKTAYELGQSVNSLATEFSYHVQFEQAGVRVPRAIAYVRGAGSSLIDGFLAMEAIEGDTLEEYLHKRWANGQRLSIAEYKDTMQDIDEQIAKAHDAKLFHRDLHLNNILINENGQAVIIDFGDAVRGLGSDDDLSIYRGQVVREGRIVPKNFLRDDNYSTEFNRILKEFWPKDTLTKT